MGQTEVLHYLAAATAAASAASVAVFATTVIVDYVQFKHDIHLLSNRHLSMEMVKKIGVQRAHALQPYWFMTFTSFSVVSLSGANLIISCPQQTAMFSWFNE
jgi:hypothetical protein